MHIVSTAIRIVVAMAVFLTIGPAKAQDRKDGALNKEQLQHMYVDYLAMEGYKPEVDADGDVRFKREGRTYFIGVS